jgi:hypothetical protein
VKAEHKTPDTVIDATRKLLCPECGKTEHPRTNEQGDFCGACGEKIRNDSRK